MFLAELLVPACSSFSPVFEVYISCPIKHRHVLHQTNREVSWLWLDHSLQNGIQSIEVASSKSNSPDSTAATKSLTDIVPGLEELSFVEDSATW